MHENKERLTRIGNAILSASRNELYLSMRFFDLALSGLGYQMNLNTATIATDGVNILYNPTYLQRQYVDDMIQLNRTYLHMVLHCLFRHPFHRGDRDPALWDVACDIAVESILDSMEVKTVAHGHPPVPRGRVRPAAAGVPGVQCRAHLSGAGTADHPLGGAAGLLQILPP